MTALFEDYAFHELKHHFRKEVSKKIRDNCPEADPMAKGVTIMLGSILAMTFFSAVLFGHGRGR